MKLHELYPHNKFLFFTGVILCTAATYLDNTNKASDSIILSLLILALLLMLLGFRKTKRSNAAA